MKSLIKDGIIGVIVALVTMALAFTALAPGGIGAEALSTNTMIISYAAVAVVGAIIGMIAGAVLNLISKE